MNHDENDVKIDRFFAIDVELIVEDAGQAFASVELNPTLSWIKFILTDDKPNANNNRIPREEFPNLISSGLYMPIKMTTSEIEGHAEAVPIGVITHLKEKGNKIVGLAALWQAEYSEEISYLKDRYANKKSLDLSWEIMHASSHLEDDVEVLTDTILRAATFVKVPAYNGRTYVTELSENKEEEILETKNLEEIKTLYEEKLNDKQSAIETLEAEVQTLKESQLTEELKAELEELREFKARLDEELERQEQIESIKGVFSEFDVEVNDAFIEEREELLLSMSEEALKFFAETYAKAQKVEENDDEETKSKEAETKKVPNLKGEDRTDEKLTISELAHKAKALKNK